MIELVTHLNRLSAFLREQKAPPWTGVLIVEKPAIVPGFISFIPRSALHAPLDYQHRFKELIKAGALWINLQAAGILDGKLLVIVEWPKKQTGTHRKVSTAINLSGPSLQTQRLPTWNLSSQFKIVD